MKNKNLVLSALLLTIGLVLHTLVPGIFGLMKPDFLVAFFFMALFLLDSLQEAITVSVACAILASMTTSMPGGEVANIVDKLVCGPIVFILGQRVKQMSPLLQSLTLGTLGTLLSGSIFLITLSFLGLLPMDFIQMILVIVVPTAIANTFLFFILLKALQRVRPNYNQELQIKHR